MLELWLEPLKHPGGLIKLVNGVNKAVQQTSQLFIFS
jgi:hypothetical protein